MWPGNQKWLDKFLCDEMKVVEAEDATQAKEVEEAARTDDYWRPIDITMAWPPTKPVRRPKKPVKKPAKKPVKRTKAKSESDIPEEEIDVERFKKLMSDTAKTVQVKDRA